MDPDHRGPLLLKELRDVLEAAEAALSGEIQSRLDASPWIHLGTAEVFGRATTVRMSADRDVGSPRLNVTMNARTMRLVVHVHEDDPERNVAANQDAVTALAAVRRRVALGRSVLDHADRNGHLVHPERSMIAKARAIALREAIDPRHHGLPVWYRAPWEAGRSMLSQHPERDSLPCRARRWGLGEVTLVSRVVKAGESVYRMRPICERSPIEADAIEQMRLLAMLEDES